MKKYAVIDLQGCDFMSYTHEEPMTRKELLEHFRGFCEVEDKPLSFADSLKSIKDIWEIDLVVVK
jgi:hypothetical protein